MCPFTRVPFWVPIFGSRVKCGLTSSASPGAGGGGLGRWRGAHLPAADEKRWPPGAKAVGLGRQLPEAPGPKTRGQT